MLANVDQQLIIKCSIVIVLSIQGLHTLSKIRFLVHVVDQLIIDNLLIPIVLTIATTLCISAAVETVQEDVLVLTSVKLRAQIIISMSFHLWKAGVPFCNAYMSIDECLKATSEQSSRFGLCYSNGKTIIPLPIATLQKLLDFVTNHDSSDCQATNFYKNIRAFNSAFAFASIKANVDERLASGTDGVSTFHVNGTIYHNVGAL
ncbi:hypothetical protein PHYBLDRAFT_69629 [Phycomyces blakesleeanus NRRL 1555(-)]|uniref:Uncharacterized protein n=1 Tax=Phycomyces blakesleeanus (strain ATCC 8743b / DSM 1359 / FGSC 10004 / NBRC 33097 / NRRL 1555) TaxID=763407 RepID=A0A163DD53_PHYB8|nr:hypothetical protein PHYBLDRAFT_69629 [Phycomyces blakesleeanus NRRL 1555(-)]OAD70540.1 hypothetical protein PHYBLDRAFT_69629 [Phycomyces blakesleeanus NRRL 1555(-)]|eukprot:XP_018288580.1 hypothetical protein PHYBLDRAFT_69629 [Phycomyces blakesleeanus NRRL 1555(-)]